MKSRVKTAAMFTSDKLASSSKIALTDKKKQNCVNKPYQSIQLSLDYDKTKISK